MRSSVATATVPPRKPARLTVKAAQHDPPADSEHDFFWTYTEEPHRTRRMAIIKAHPEVRQPTHAVLRLSLTRCRSRSSADPSRSPNTSSLSSCRCKCSALASFATRLCCHGLFFSRPTLSARLPTRTSSSPSTRSRITWPSGLRWPTGSSPSLPICPLASPTAPPFGPTT